MKVTPVEDLEKRYFTPKEIRKARSKARRMVLVEFVRFDEGPWIVFVRGPRGTNVHGHGETIGAARRCVRAELAAAAGKARAAKLWRGRVETMPAGAEEREEPRRRRATGSRPAAARM
jgi:hypothetical protein